jgi:hypothetical protein
MILHIVKNARLRYVHSYKNITKLESNVYGNNFPKLSLRPWSVVREKFCPVPYPDCVRNMTAQKEPLQWLSLNATSATVPGLRC